MLVHPLKTVVLDAFGTGKTQIAVKMSGTYRPVYNYVFCVVSTYLGFKIRSTDR